MPKPHIFISYSRVDGEPHVSRLEEALKADGVLVWRDTRNLKADQDFTADIEGAIEAASHVAVILTPDTKRENSFVRREIQYALAVGKPVLPLRFADIPPHVSIVNNEWFDFFKQWNGAYERLLAILEGADYSNTPQDAPDPFRPYLESALRRVVEYLKRAVIRQIDLYADDTPDALPTEQQKPDMLDQFFAALAWEDDDSAPPQFQSFREACEHYNGRVLLLGEPGAGKTITLMAHARDAITARLDDPTRPLPLLGVVATWDADKQTPIAEWITSGLRDLDAMAAKREIAAGRALLLLDGLDELGGERPVDPTKPDGEKYDPRERFVRMLNPLSTSGGEGEASAQRMAARHSSWGGVGDNQLIITCRVKDYNDLRSRGDVPLPVSGAVTLNPLTDEQMQHYLSDHGELWAALQRDDHLREVARTPLLLSLLAFAFADLREEAGGKAWTDALPADLSSGDLRDRIFLAYVRRRYLHEARKPGAKLPFTLDQLLDTLRWLAMANTSGKRYWVRRYYLPTRENLLEWADFNHILPEAQQEPFKALCVQLHILQLAEPDTKGRNTYRFIHLLLRDALTYTYGMTLLREGHPDIEVRRAGITALGRLDDPRVVDALITALNDDDLSVRRRAANALDRWRDPRSTEALIAALEEPDAEIATHAARTLGKIGDARALEPLVKALEHRQAAVRRRAATALGRLGDVRAVDALIAALYNRDAETRSRALVSLAYLGDPRAIVPMVGKLSDRSSAVREQLFKTLPKFGAAAIDALIDALGHEDAAIRRRAAMMLAQLGETRATDALIALLDDPLEFVQQGAAEALELLGTPEALEAAAAWKREGKAE